MDTLDEEITKLEALGESTLGSREDRDEAYMLAEYFRSFWLLAQGAVRKELKEA